MVLNQIRARFGKALMEAIGTFVLLLTIQLAVHSPSNSDKAPMSIGLVLMVLVYAGAPISGAHYNPAVTLALTLTGRGCFHAHGLIVYWIFQYAGAIAGAAVGNALIPDNDEAANIAVDSHVTVWQALGGELVFTTLLCLVVLCTATHSKVENNGYFGAAIGLTVTAGAVAAGPWSGGAFNPAVSLGLGIVAMDLGSGYNFVTALVNLLGGVVAAALFYLVAPDQYDPTQGQYEPIAGGVAA